MSKPATTTGTKEDDVCSNHGHCNESLGVCKCLDDWQTSDGYGSAGTRGDCGFRSSGTTSSCPGEPACLGYGTCQGPPTYRCVCQNGRTGPDCSELACPEGPAWFSMPTSDNTAHSDMECSGMGLCDHQTGVCECREGFEGSACQYLVCENDCHGNGQCLSMASLAAAYGVDYGSDPNNPLTWDAHTVSGCQCSDGFEGPTCKHRVCPKGDDPNTRHQSNEIQVLSCVDSDNSGQFEVGFMDESIQVSSTATAADIETALNTLASVEAIYVGAPGLDPDALQVCRASGGSVDVEFLVPTGNVPELSISNAVGIDGALSVTTSRDGTKEYSECSDRGLCDHDTGLCECFTGFGSSDGQGQAGHRDDCGYRLEYAFDS